VVLTFSGNAHSGGGGGGGGGGGALLLPTVSNQHLYNKNVINSNCRGNEVTFQIWTCPERSVISRNKYALLLLLLFFFVE